MIGYDLHLRYTSLHEYKLLLELFPIPFLLLLKKIQQDGIDALKALNKCYEKRLFFS